MKLMFRLILCLSVVGCASGPDKFGGDTGDVAKGGSGLGVEGTCGGDGDLSLTIGTGVGEQFVPMEPGAEMGLDVAPQGGFGVTVRARTTGILSEVDDVPHAPASVELNTWIVGELSAGFLNENVEIYCQEDGTGLIWGVVVGFDPEEYASTDDLFRLHGQTVSLQVVAHGSDGDTAEGWVDVVISVGR